MVRLLSITAWVCGFGVLNFGTGDATALAYQDAWTGVQQAQPQTLAPMRPTVVGSTDRGGISQAELRNYETSGGLGPVGSSDRGGLSDVNPSDFRNVQFGQVPVGQERAGDVRNDSTILDVRPLQNRSLPSLSSSGSVNTGPGTSFDQPTSPGFPVRTSLTESNRVNERELEQGQGFGSQSNFSQSPWIPSQSSGPVGQVGQASTFGQGTSMPGLNSPLPRTGAAGTGGLPPTNLGAGTGPLVQTPSGDPLAGGSRMLQSDRVERPATADNNTMYRLQEIGKWDIRLALPDVANSLVSSHRGRRPSLVGEDDFSDNYFSSERTFDQERTQVPRGELPTTNTSLTGSSSTGGGSTGGGSTATGGGNSSQLETESQAVARKSTDQLASLLTICFFLANLVLAYFLYDSRMKYQHLADEIQSRFFRES